MRCLICRSLELALETHQKRYSDAASLACNKITTRLAAYWNVEMERARNDLDDHRAVCVFFASSSIAPAVPHRQFAGQGPVEGNVVAPAA